MISSFRPTPGLDISETLIILDIFRHALVSIKVEVRVALISCFRFRKPNQASAKALPLVFRVYSNVIQEDTIFFSDENENSNNLFVLLCNIRMMLANHFRVIIEHRPWRLSNTRNIMPVCVFNARLHC